MGFWNAFTVFTKRPSAPERRRGVGVSLPPEVRAAVVQLWEWGYSVDEAVAEMLERGEPVSKASVYRFYSAEERKKESGNGQRPSAQAGELARGIEEIGKAVAALDKIAGRSEPVAPPLRAEPETADDIIEDIRAKAARRIQDDPQVIAAVAESIKIGLLQDLGASPNPRQTALERVAAAIEERVAEELLNGRKADEDDGWKGFVKDVLRGVADDVLVPYARARLDDARANGALPPPASSPPQEEPRVKGPTKLLGVFLPADLLPIFDQEDPGRAAQTAWSRLLQAVMPMADDARALAELELGGFVSAREVGLRVKLGLLALAEPAWAPVIARFWAHSEEWREVFRDELGRLLEGEEDPEDPESEADEEAATAVI